MPRRVYGYKKRDEYGRRYQDGFGAQAKSDKPVEISKEILTPTLAAEEVIEVKVRGEKKVELPVEEPKVTALIDDGEETGPLPKHMTDFMPMNAQASETTPEELIDPE